MKKRTTSRRVALLLTILAIALTLSGCVYGNGTVTISADGSGKVIVDGGFSKDVLDKLGQTPKDFFGKYSEYHLLELDGKEYLVTTFEDAFLTPERMNTTTIGSVSREFGVIDLVPIKGGFRLEIELWEHIGPNMTYAHTWPGLDRVSPETLEGMTVLDLIVQEVDGLFLKLTFNMPYEVRQTKGGQTGILVEGNQITLDYIQMINSGDREWIFESTSA